MFTQVDREASLAILSLPRPWIFRLTLRKRLVIERYFLINNLMARIQFIIVMIKWTGPAPWEFEFPFPGSLTSTFLAGYKAY